MTVLAALDIYERTVNFMSSTKVFLYHLLVPAMIKDNTKPFLVFRRVRNITKSDSLHSSRLSVHPSVRPHGTTRLPLFS